MKVKALSLLAALALMGAVLPDRTPEPDFKTVTITIGLSGGQITVSPDPAVGVRGDVFAFRIDPASSIETLNIRFRSATPLGAAAASRGGLNGNRGNPARGTVTFGAAVGARYKYNIRIFDGQRTINLDPEIVIGPGEDEAR